MSEELPIRYTVSILLYEETYHGIIYIPETNEYARCSNPNLTKLMNLVSSRIRKKEREVKNFPLPSESPLVVPDEKRIIIPNGA